ncbi:amidophosphoribosyltransferase [candidate division KSB1 bacterium]
MCGILGILQNTPIVQDLYDGLVVLQHRGQDAAGIATFDGNQIHLKKGNGLVRDVFRTKNIIRLKGNMGIGHVRYLTAGCSGAEEAQPFYVNAPFGIALAHNGTLTNYEQLKKEVHENNLRHLNTTSDSEVLLNILAFELSAETKNKLPELKPVQIFKAMKRVLKRIEGGYAVVSLIVDHGVLAFRDPSGIRPLIIGTRENGGKTEYAIASESVSIQTLGFKILRDVAPGEAIYIDKNNELHSSQCAKAITRPCIFEYVYLARPDSMIDGISVYKTRLRMGQYLAKQIKKDKLNLDVVIPVPETSRHIAITLASELNVKYREGFMKNRYIGRTFIMPNQAVRQKSIHYKLNPIPLEFRNKNVLLVDDSIVRGNTSKQIVAMVREAGAKKVYFASAAPPLINPCVYGIDMPTRKDLIANKLDRSEICKMINADKLYYQKYEDLERAAHIGNPKIKKFCWACMGGKYPAGNITEEVLQRTEQLREACEESENEDQMTLL